MFQRLRELVILVTGRRWNAEYEWFAHEPFAQKHGVSQAVRQLHDRGLDVPQPPIGMMVEVPAAAFSLEAFEADFYSIGSNDLLQYLVSPTFVLCNLCFIAFDRQCARTRIELKRVNHL